MGLERKLERRSSLNLAGDGIASEMLSDIPRTVLTEPSLLGEKALSANSSFAVLGYVSSNRCMVVNAREISTTAERWDCFKWRPMTGPSAAAKFSFGKRVGSIGPLL